MKDSNRHCGRAKKNKQSRVMIYFTILFLAMTFSVNGLAEDKKQLDDILQENTLEATPEKDPSRIYAPRHCDFEITFPDEPFEAKRCPQDSAKCYGISNYTMVYDLKTTVDVSATCVPSSAQNFDRYDERVIQTVLNGMATKTAIEDPSINIVNKENYRIGTLIGTGTYARQNRIYNAQIWIGQNSVMTIEAKLVGSSHQEADAVFTDILKSTKKKED